MDNHGASKRNLADSLANDHAQVAPLMESDNILKREMDKRFQKLESILSTLTSAIKCLKSKPYSSKNIVQSQLANDIYLQNNDKNNNIKASDHESFFRSELNTQQPNNSCEGCDEIDCNKSNYFNTKNDKHYLSAAVSRDYHRNNKKTHKHKTTLSRSAKIISTTVIRPGESKLVNMFPPSDVGSKFFPSEFLKSLGLAASQKTFTGGIKILITNISKRKKTLFSKRKIGTFVGAESHSKNNTQTKVETTQVQQICAISAIPHNDMRNKKSLHFKNRRRVKNKTRIKGESNARPHPFSPKQCGHGYCASLLL